MPGDLAFILISPWMAVAGAVGVSIPLLIHLLFRRRRKPVKWAAMLFLEEAWSSRRRRIRLEQMILLFIRCAIPVLLGLALAQPVLDGFRLLPGSGRSIHLIIDDGVVSNTTNSSGQSDFDIHIERAISILESLNPGDRAVVTLTTDPKSTQAGGTDVGTTMNWLKTISPSEQPSRIPDALMKVRDELVESESPGSSEVYLLSSFREGGFDPDIDHETEFPEGVSLSYSRPFEEHTENTRINRLEPLRNIRIERSSANDPSIDRTIMIELERDGNMLPGTSMRLNTIIGSWNDSRTITWEKGESTKTVGMELPNEVDVSNGIKAHVESDDSMSIDDSRYLALESSEAIHVLLLDRPGEDNRVFESRSNPGAGRWIQYALQPGSKSTYRILEMDPSVFQMVDLHDVDVVILTRPDLVDRTSGSWIRTHLDSGGLVLVTPPESLSTHEWVASTSSQLGLSWNASMEPRIHDPSTSLALPTDPPDGGSPLELISAELPALLETTRVHQSLEMKNIESANVLLTLEDGSPAIISGGSRGVFPGNVIFMTFPPSMNWTDMPTRPLMVPLFHELIRGGLSSARKSSSGFVGEFVDAGHGVVSISNDGVRIPIIEETGMTSTSIPNRGLWTMFDNRGAAVGQLALNTRPGSTDTTPGDPETVSNWLGGEWTRLESDSTRTASHGNHSSLVFPLLLILAILVILETVMGRMFTRSIHPGVG